MKIIIRSAKGVKKLLLLSALLVTLLLFTNVAQVLAQSEYPNQPITDFGLQGGQAFFSYTGINTTCLYSYMYLDTTTPSGKSLYALLLAIKMTEKNIYRIDYDIVNGQCWANIIVTQN